MSQLTSTVLRSCGLTVGWNMAPPPPGPITRKLPGRASPLPLVRRRNARSARRKKSVISFLCFPYHLFRFLSCRIGLLCQSLSSLFRLKMALGFDLQKPGSILVVHLLEDLIRQTKAINAPAALRGHSRRRIVEVFILGF